MLIYQHQFKINGEPLIKPNCERADKQKASLIGIREAQSDQIEKAILRDRLFCLML